MREDKSKFKKSIKACFIMTSLVLSFNFLMAENVDLKLDNVDDKTLPGDAFKPKINTVLKSPVIPVESDNNSLPQSSDVESDSEKNVILKKPNVQLNIKKPVLLNPNIQFSPKNTPQAQNPQKPVLNQERLNEAFSNSLEIVGEKLRKRGLVSAQGENWSKTLKISDSAFVPSVNKTVKQMNNSNDICKSERVELKANADSLGSLSDDFIANSAPDWMKPGVIMTASSFLNGRYKIVNEPRKEINLYSDLITGQSETQRVLEPHKPSNLQAAISTISFKNNIKVPAKFSIDYKEIHSAEELSFYVNGAYSNSLVGASGKLGFSSNSKNSSHYYLINFTQNLFQIASDPLETGNVFLNQAYPNDELLYVSRVSYGRKGIAIIKSDHDMKKFTGSVEASLNQLIHKGNLKSGFDYLKDNKNFSLKAIIYGGDSKAAIESVMDSIESNSLNLGKYLATQAANPTLAVPISYQIKNIYNERLGVHSAFKKEVSTCVPGLTESVRLKVTLTDLQNIESRDGRRGNGDDYGLRQSVNFNALGQMKFFNKKDIRKFESKHDEQIMKNGVLQVYTNLLVNGNKSRQIHVTESAERLSNIGNSLYFDISRSEFEDPNKSMNIITRLSEYTGSDDAVLANNERIEIPLDEIMAYLLDPEGNTIKFEQDFYYANLIRGSSNTPDNRDAIKFHATGVPGQKLWLTEGFNGSIEGPVLLGRRGMRAATWINFSLIK